MAEGGPSPQSPSTGENTDTDELTSCPICFERYVKPKYLPCLHTFCEACLQSYITKGHEDKSAGFKCPLCRTFVPAPGNPDGPSEWAALLPVNHFMNSLMDRNNLKSGEKLCQACKRENETESATSWCKECMEALCAACCKYHRRHLLSNFHELVPIEQISFDSLPVRSEILNCSEHTDKRLEFYCADHKVPCCITCVTLLHRKCESVDSVTKIAGEFRKSTETEELLGELNKRRNDLLNSVKRHTENITEIEEDAKQIAQEITNFADEITQHVTKMKQKSLAELAQVRKTETQMVNKGKEQCENITSLLDNYHKMITMAQKHGSDVHFFLEYQQIRQLYANWQQTQQKEMSQIKIARIKWDVSDSAQKWNTDVQCLGEITVRKTSESVCDPEIDLMTATPVLIKEFPSPFGLVASGAIFLTDDSLLLADRRLPRCVVVNKDGVVLREIKLDKKPFGLDLFTEDTALISFEDESFVQKLDTKTWNLGEKTMLDYTCTAISYCNDGLVYASNSTFVHKFNLTGLDSDICRSLNSYCIKAHDTDHIVVGNYGNYTVKCMSSNGSEKFVYRSSNLKHPFGLDVDRQGNAYIVGLTSRNLHQVSFDGKRSRILLQDAVGGQDTCCVKFKPLSQEFLVTADGGKMLKFYKMDRA